LKISLVVAVYFIILLCIISQREVFTFYDEASRCMDSIFYMSLMKSFPSDIMTYVERFYSYYPGLYIIFYPPLNQLITGFFYLLFGINNITSRLSTLIFSVLSVVFFHKLASEFYPKELKNTMILILLSSPYFIFLSTTNYLEVQMMFFVVSCSYYFFKTFLKGEDHSMKLGILLGIGFLIKWSIVILYLAFLIFLLFKRGGEIFKKRFLKMSLLFFLISAPFLCVMLLTGGLNALLKANVYMPFTMSDLHYYLYSPFIIFFPVFGLLGLCGLYSLCKKRRLPQYFFILVYFIVLLIVFTFVIRSRKHRYVTMFYLPYFPILISLALKHIRKKYLYPLVIVLILLQVAHAFYATIDGSGVFELNRGLGESSSLVVEGLPENSNILVLDDSPIFVYYLYQKLPLFSHHIVRLKHCENVSDFNLYLQENNIYYIIGMSKHLRRFPELESLNKTVIGGVEIYKTNITEFPEKEICNGFCKVDYVFCSK